MHYFLGVDVGGTKTHALIADETGRAVGFGQAGAGNWQSVGFDGLEEVVGNVLEQALRRANLGLNQIRAAGFGIAGYDWPSQLEAHLHAVESLGLSCPLELTNDAIIGLLAGASQGWGVVVVAGTGNNCRGRDRRGREGRITGEGELFGEYGGGGEIVRKAIQAIAHEWTKRGPETLLSLLFQQKSGAASLGAFIEGIDLGLYDYEASWAPMVFQAAALGDPTAREVLAWSGRELGESACAVIRQLQIQNERFEMVMAGSIFEGGALYVEPFKAAVRQFAAGAKFVRLAVPPVAGGVVLAMQKAGRDTISIHKTLIDSTSKIIQHDFLIADGG